MQTTSRYDKDDLLQALQVLQKGGVILYPTDTVWGIGCDATNAEAVRRIYEIKQRDDHKSMLVLLDEIGKIPAYVKDMPSIAYDLLEVVNNTDCAEEDKSRPLTIIYPNAQNLAENLIAEDGSIGIRLTEEKFSHDLVARLHHPLVSTSANVSGQPTPRIFAEIPDEIKQKVDYIVRFRQDDTVLRQSSSIIKLGLNGEIQIIRK